MSTFYNEVDPYASQWLRNLSDAGHIAQGIVANCDVRHVTGSDLDGFTQCHFFAGIGVWSHALRLAGWPDDRPVWTGSCPCQPFSQAGRGRGTSDERHLWPSFFRLISECRPRIVLGEQVASPVALAWLDSVRSDLEGEGYAFAAFDLCAASVGAPHIRQRLYFVALSSEQRFEGERLHLLEGQPRDAVAQAPRSGKARRVVADAQRDRLQGSDDAQARKGAKVVRRRSADASAAGLVGDSSSVGSGRNGRTLPAAQARRGEEGLAPRRLAHESVAAGAAGHFWSEANWLPCKDGKLRPVEPGTFPLAHRAPSRVVRLRAYGNAIVAPLAAAFIEEVMELLQ
ncbi:MAG: DNA cytosine methyltransferase [Candidatus Cryosericum sp.]